VTPLRASIAAAVRKIDGRLRQWSGRRRVLVYVRNAMHVGVLEPVTRALERDPRVAVTFIPESAGKRAHIDRASGRARSWTTSTRVRWRRVDLLITADPWNPPVMYRCYRRMNFFHGVAGKYNLDDPSHLPIGFDVYDRVAFVNADRMQRYLALGILKSDAARLVGYPKLDALVNGRYDAAAVRERLALDMHRPTALYAPTWSPASSLNFAGETIVASLVDAGFNVIVKPHDLSFDPDPKYSGGIDWRGRLRAIERGGRVVVVSEPDSTPLLPASDVVVTDHSSIAFEFCLLDRPIVVVDAPDLPRVARINPERIALLRSAARVVFDPTTVGAAAAHELDHPNRYAPERAAIARSMFHEPGAATERALAVVYDLLEMSPPPQVAAAAAAERRSLSARFT
jgi:CDP-glycerol glycerophosphotransferase (TagB/SpsB family)